MVIDINSILAMMTMVVSASLPKTATIRNKHESANKQGKQCNIF